jgi:hypothetical protein
MTLSDKYLRYSHHSCREALKAFRKHRDQLNLINFLTAINIIITMVPGFGQRKCKGKPAQQLAHCAEVMYYLFTSCGYISLFAFTGIPAWKPKRMPKTLPAPQTFTSPRGSEIQ